MVCWPLPLTVRPLDCSYCCPLCAVRQSLQVETALIGDVGHAKPQNG
jgi:hypothetical protein